MSSKNCLTTWVDGLLATMTTERRLFLLGWEAENGDICLRILAI